MKFRSVSVFFVALFIPSVAFAAGGLQDALNSTKDDALGLLTNGVAPLAAIASMIYTVWAMARNEGQGAGIAFSVCIASIVGMNFTAVLDIMRSLASNIGH